MQTDTGRGVYPGQPSSSRSQLPWTVMVTPPPKHGQQNPTLRPHAGVSRHSLPACSLAHYGLPNMRQTPPQGPTPTRHGPQIFQPELRQDSIDKNRTQQQTTHNRQSRLTPISTVTCVRLWRSWALSPITNDYAVIIVRKVGFLTEIKRCGSD